MPTGFGQLELFAPLCLCAFVPLSLRHCWYRFLRFLFRLWFALLFRYRCEGQRHIPDAGAALILSSHQSYLDPMLVGLGHRRPFHYLARDTLFRFPLLGWFIRSVNGIPIDREGMGIAGLKETLRRLKRGEIVVLFPEGTRTYDGQIRPLKPGFAALARRGKMPLIPAAVVGAHECWPRSRRLPRPGRILVQFGPPLPHEEVARYDDRQLVAEVQRRIQECHDQAMAKRARGQLSADERR